MSVLSELLIDFSSLAPCSGSVGWLTLSLCCWEQAWMLYSHRGVWLCGNCQTVGIIEWKQQKHECCMLNLTLNIPILEDTIGMMMELVQIEELSLWVNLSRCEIGGPECSSVFSHPWRPAPSLIHTEEGVLRALGRRLCRSTTWWENRPPAPQKRSVGRSLPLITKMEATTSTEPSIHFCPDLDRNIFTGHSARYSCCMFGKLSPNLSIGLQKHRTSKAWWQQSGYLFVYPVFQLV